MDRTPLRLIVCLGALLSTAGVILSMFATKLFHLYITIGVIMGTGNCMVYLPSAVLVGLYFTKNRTFATALSSCGSSIGIVLMPIIYTSIIEAYTWRGSMFIIAGLSMQTLVFSALLRPVNGGQNIKEEVFSVSDIHSQSDFAMRHVDTLSNKDDLHSMYDLSSMNERSSEHTTYDGDGALPHNIYTGLGKSEIKHDNQAIKDSLFDSSGMSIHALNHLEEESVALAETHETRNHKPIMADKKMSGMDSTLYRLRQNVMFDSRFLIYIINNIMWNLGASTMTVITADYLYTAGANKLQFSIIMLMVGVGSVIGAVLFAFLAKWKPSHLISMYCGLCVSCGLVAVLFAVTTDIVVIGVLGSLFGMTSGGIVSWLLGVLADLIGTSKLSEAFGYIMLANGIGNLAGPPLGGWLCDVTGNYRATIWIAGSLIFGWVRFADGYDTFKAKICTTFRN